MLKTAMWKIQPLC